MSDPVKILAGLVKEALYKDPQIQRPSMDKIAKVLTALGRKHIKEENYAIPEKKKYPIHDITHARNALARVSQFGTPEERARVRAAVYRRYPSLRKEFEERHGVSPLKKEVLKAKETGNITPDKVRSASLVAQAARMILDAAADIPADLTDEAVKVGSSWLNQAMSVERLFS